MKTNFVPELYNVALFYQFQINSIKSIYYFVLVDVKLKRKKCFSKPSVWIASVLIVIVLTAVGIISAYLEGAFDSGPELPERMEGEATLTSSDGNEKVFHVMIDYKKKLVQLNSLDNGVGGITNKIVVQDYNKVS